MSPCTSALAPYLFNLQQPRDVPPINSRRTFWSWCIVNIPSAIQIEYFEEKKRMIKLYSCIDHSMLPPYLPSVVHTYQARVFGCPHALWLSHHRAVHSLRGCAEVERWSGREKNLFKKKQIILFFSSPSPANFFLQSAYKLVGTSRHSHLSNYRNPMDCSDL